MGWKFQGCSGERGFLYLGFLVRTGSTDSIVVGGVVVVVVVVVVVGIVAVAVGSIVVVVVVVVVGGGGSDCSDFVENVETAAVEQVDSDLRTGGCRGSAVGRKVSEEEEVQWVSDGVERPVFGLVLLCLREAFLAGYLFSAQLPENLKILPSGRS